MTKKSKKEKDFMEVGGIQLDCLYRDHSFAYMADYEFCDY